MTSRRARSGPTDPGFTTSRWARDHCCSAFTASRITRTRFATSSSISPRRGIVSSRPSCGAMPRRHRRRGRTFYVADLAHDVVELVKSLGAGRATLLGHDWGAHAAYGAAVLAPEMFDRIVTLAVPYGPGLREAFVTSPEQQRRSWYIFFFQSRLAEAALAYDDHALVERLWRDWSPGWTHLQTT